MELITRDEAFQELKSLWQVDDFTFLAKFDVPISQRELDEPDAFGFFIEIYWNKKRLYIPGGADSVKRNFATCYAKKAGLKHNTYYMITAELSPDNKREKNPYALTLSHAKEATQEEIELHSSNIDKMESVHLAYVNFIARDRSHAYVKIVEDLDLNSIKRTSSEKGEVMHDFPEEIVHGQIIYVKKKRNYGVSFLGDIFRGRLCNASTFIDLDTFPDPLSLYVSSSTGFSNEELRSHNSRINCCVNIYNERSGFGIERIESKKNFNFSDFDEFVKKNIHELLDPKLSDIDFESKQKFLEKVDVDFKKKIAEVFDEDCKLLSSDSSENLIIEFLLKWFKRYPEFLLFSRIGRIEFLGLFMKMWHNKLLPLNFFEDQLLHVFINSISSQQIGIEDFLEGLHPNGFVLLKDKYLELLDIPISIESVEVYTILVSLLHKFPLTPVQKNKVVSVIKSSITDDVQLELWREGKLDNVPLRIALLNFNALDAKLQAAVVLELKDDQLIPILNQIKPTDNAQVNRRIEILNQRLIFERLGFLVFDIESDTNKIDEIAWSNGESIKNFINKEVDGGVAQFKEDSQGKIIIGHNILDFDLPILSKIQEFQFDHNLVWDTLSVEKVLSPELKTYALNGEHHAKQDVEVNLALFKNQFLRVLKLIRQNTNLLNGVLSKEVLSRIELLGKEYQFHISYTALNQSKLIFFRPQPKTNSLIESLKDQMNLSNIEKKIILGDESLLSDFMSYGQVTFSETFSNKLDFQLLNIQSVTSSSQLKESQRGQLLSYCIYCEKHGLIPFWGNVSPSIRNEIEEGMDVWSLFSDKSHMQYFEHYPRYIFSSELHALDRNMSDTHLFIIQPDLISISQKHLLKQLDVEQLKAMFQSNFFWMKFSGGQSVVSISKDDVQKLVNENLEEFDCFWIEKYQFGKYRVFAKKNWEQIISTFSFKRKSIIDLDPEQFKSDQVVSVKFTANKNGDYNVTRFNPESIYRSRYWVIQKKIIDQLVVNGDSILIIQRPEEIGALTKYFESDGYYIPKHEIGLGRRLELLHRNTNPNKLIIAHFGEVDSVLKWNHTAPINLIVDSFNFVESYYCAEGTTFFNDYVKDAIFNNKESFGDINDIDESETLDLSLAKKTSDFQKDYIFLLKLLRPKITSLRNLLQINHPDNRLYLLDPRIDDFNELRKQWNISKHSVYGWNNKEDFEKEVAKTEGIFKGPKPLEIPYTEDETIEIIRTVFIGKYTWKEEQLPYLREILRSKEDWLINLPTGMGKSVLFQGPALLKSAFTNRMTIVITPLKALMEDHVNQLWKKGFYGCVDYLNSDRSSDTELIYRAIAGGEMSLLFVTPERFRSKGFLNALDTRIQSDGGLEYFVFDEAHCVSQWGHDFRPDYFNCAKMVWRTKSLSSYSTPLLLFSATVTDQTYHDFNSIFS